MHRGNRYLDRGQRIKSGTIILKSVLRTQCRKLITGNASRCKLFIWTYGSTRGDVELGMDRSESQRVPLSFKICILKVCA